MDKNFRVRVVVGICMFAVAVVALYTFDTIPFRVLYGLFAVMAGVELTSFFWRKRSALNMMLAILEMLFLIGGVVFASLIDPAHFWYIILGVCGYDIFAYLFGKALGGKLFGRSRPFPKISKNKTWEGTLFGLFASLMMCVILMAVRGEFGPEWPYLLCGSLAVIGDLYESYLKRRFGVKDSNEIIIKNGFFEKLELAVGGSEGHGGFLDRLDSIAFACTVLLLIGLVRMAI